MAYGTDEQHLIHRTVALGSQRQNWDVTPIVSDTSLLYSIAACLLLRRDVASADYICAVKGSGLALGAALAELSGRRLIWYREATKWSLFPRGTELAGAVVAMADTHAVSGGTLYRHASFLMEQGARPICSLVIANVDQSRNEGISNQLAKEAPIAGLFSVSEARSYGLDDESVRSLESSKFWHGNVNH